MKYVVKMDYCTMAFTSGTCSLQALSNCLAGDTDLHWVQIYNSEKSPYHFFVQNSEVSAGFMIFSYGESTSNHL